MVIQVPSSSTLTHVSALSCARLTRLVDYTSHNCAELLAEEIELIKSLTDFPVVVASAGENFAPSIIAAYAYDLAKTFNGYYHDHSILREENEEKRRMRVMLAALVARTISKAMKLLGIDVPQRM